MLNDPECIVDGMLMETCLESNVLIKRIYEYRIWLRKEVLETDR